MNCLNSGLLLIVLSLAWGALALRATQNDRPIIGILTQPSDSSLTKYGSNYIAASYVKYVESAGARVVPVRHDAPFSVLQQYFNQLNGILFPGGGSDLNNTTLFKAGNYLYNLALEAADRGDIFPIFGHCQGFELLTMITSQNFNILGFVDAENITLPLNFTSNAKNSRMFSKAPAEIINTLATQPVTMNNHQWGLYPSTYNKNTVLNTFYNVLSLNDDREGTTFVSTMESKKYPIYAVQWHPEKNQFEWNPDEVINHTPSAIQAMEYMSSFFVSQARLSSHAYPSAAAEELAVIYNYPAIYTVYDVPDFEQCYFFPNYTSSS